MNWTLWTQDILNPQSLFVALISASPRGTRLPCLGLDVSACLDLPNLAIAVTVGSVPMTEVS